MYWKVLEGRPSWHQQRAGGTYAAATVGFTSKEAADAYVARCREHRPNESFCVVADPNYKPTPNPYADRGR